MVSAIKWLFLICFFSCKGKVQSFQPPPGKVIVLKHPNETRLVAKQGQDLDLEKAQLEKEFMSISIFSFFHQAYMPFGDVVDGLFISRLDAGSLGASGIARSTQKSINKLLNSPLSKTTISMIASAVGENDRKDDKGDSLSMAVSSSLCLAVMVGCIQLFLFGFGARQVLGLAGIEESSVMFSPALGFLKIQAFGAPAATMWLVSTNIFRGLGDASTPLVCAMIFNIFNLFGDFVFVNRMKLGVTGSSIATSFAQTLALFPMLLILKGKVPVKWFQYGLTSFKTCISQYSRAGLLLMGRSVARIAAFSYCSRRSAMLGPVAASSYSILYQLGFWVTMSCESVSIATQSLLARHSTDDSIYGRSMSTFIIRRSFLVGISLSISLSLLILLFRYPLISAFAKSQEIQSATIETLPVFLVTQLVKGFVFPMNGVVLGKKDWLVSFWSMCFANVLCFSSLHFLQRQRVQGLWIAWTAYYLAQGIFGLTWYKKKSCVN